MTRTAPLSTPDLADYMAAREPVLTAEHLTIDYQAERPVRAVDDVSLVLNRGEILGLAGSPAAARRRSPTASTAC